MKRRIAVSIASVALCLGALVIAQAGAATRAVSASGGSVTLTATVSNAKTCGWSSSPKIAGFAKTVKCKTGTVSRSARFTANTSTTTKWYAVTLTVRGKTTTVDHWKITQAGGTPPTTTTTTVPDTGTLAPTTTTTMPVATTTTTTMPVATTTTTITTTTVPVGTTTTTTTLPKPTVTMSITAFNETCNCAVAGPVAVNSYILFTATAISSDGTDPSQGGIGDTWTITDITNPAPEGQLGLYGGSTYGQAWFQIYTPGTYDIHVAITRWGGPGPDYDIPASADYTLVVQ